MGWKLAEEVAWARPERPGPEWWTLMDIAQDARNETRQSFCGTEYLMARGKCSRATLYRRLKKLTDDKLIKVVQHSAPGRRAVYEVSDDLTTGLTIAETRSGLTNAETCTDLYRSHFREEQVSKTGVTGLSVSETPSVIPPSDHPSETPVAVVTTSVEGSGPGSAPRLPIESEAWNSIQMKEAANA